MNMRLAIGFSALLLAAALPVHAGITGEQIREEVLAANDIYDDPALQAYIEELGKDIVSVSEMAGEKFTFTLLDAPAVNAFATRGNYIYVNRGLLNYVNNEAQLVSVLAHEVAHVTEGHVEGQESKATGAQMLAAIAAMLSGSPEVYEAGMAYANSLIKGHGRSNELEADRSGARYMAALGYDPELMIEMLSTMKDLESLQKKRAREQGATKQTYHGIFATHPRNDARLRNAVSKAAKAPSDYTRGDGADRYRQLTEGLVWGENFKEKEIDPERYYNLDLRVRFDYPEGWKQQAGPRGVPVSGSPEDEAATLSMEVKGRTAQEPEEYIYNQLDLPQLSDGRSIEPARLKGYTGVLKGEGGAPDQRVAVIYYKMNAYIFKGEVTDGASFDDFDKQFLDAINTFRPISSREIAGKAPTRIHYVKANENTTFAALAEELGLNARELDDLRIVNGYYPAGEPRPGDWIKIFKQDVLE
ncbi:MAG: M48 family metalloprotease [Xanthomonadales bacterium]|nr:M48 family metalloprotease [Xanthomonadales bacterium]